jgi:hypothetical protein
MSALTTLVRAQVCSKEVRMRCTCSVIRGMPNLAVFQ